MNDWQYKWLFEQVYWVERARDDVEHHPEVNEVYKYNKYDNSLGEFKVLKVTDNTENGIQAMAVAS